MSHIFMDENYNYTGIFLWAIVHFVNIDLKFFKFCLTVKNFVILSDY